jgi:hypothetical protein
MERERGRNRQVLERTHGRFLPEHQEFKLIAGLGAVLDRLIERSEEGREPDGWFAVGLFRTLTEGIDRFRNNHLRRDVPWDAVLGVRYPDPEEIPGRIDGFHPEAAFGEDPAAFEGLHPVRRALRVLWRLARIAPFPDYNLAMSFAVGCSYLLSHGYPLLVLERGDRGVLERLIRSGAPKRATRFELRLLESVAGCRPAKGGGTVRGERDR